MSKPGAPDAQGAPDPQGGPDPQRAVTDIQVPDLGGFEDVVVIDVLAQPGDTLTAETPRLTFVHEE